MPSHSPKVLAFVCNWCSYGGADAAGGQRLEQPAGLRLVRVMCTGRIDPRHVLEAFRAGADGVLILGCHPGDCQYKEGNYRARNRVTLLRRMLPQMGVDVAQVLGSALGSVPVDFLSTLDTTGGNSGSPTLNSRGELVGLLFDGAWESLLSDWYYESERVRSIHTDVRYMLWVMDKVDGAHRLLLEMGIDPSFAER